MNLSMPASSELRAGSAVVDITPTGSVFLFGYPHVPRMSEGVHDPLQCAALYLRSGSGEVLFLANDLIHVSKAFAGRVRGEIARHTGISPHGILITATHTHSGPVVVDQLSNAADPTVPRADTKYLDFVAARMVEAAIAAHRSARIAELAVASTRVCGVGTNRHDPSGQTDSEVPLLVARAVEEETPIAVMLVYGMHPTVLHEDSRQISGDFPFFTRRYLQQKVGANCPVLFHQGASGDQSPRHVTRANTFAEAERLGELLGQQLAVLLPKLRFESSARIALARRELDLVPRQMPKAKEAGAALERARQHYEAAKKRGAPRAEIRTAEVNVFGAEETLVLATAEGDGRFAAAVEGCSPAELQVVRIGRWHFVFWPGEFFAAYALEVKRRAPGTFVGTLCNGELQAYIVTADADAKGAYEARNALFSHENGPRVVEATLALITELK